MNGRICEKCKDLHRTKLNEHCADFVVILKDKEKDIKDLEQHIKFLEERFNMIGIN